MKASGLTEDDIYSIKVVLDSYHKSNAMNLISLSSLLAKLNGKSSNSANYIDLLDSVESKGVDGRMPELIPLLSMPESIRNLVMDIKSIFDEKLHSISKELLHEKIKNDFIGLETKYTVVSGESIRRTYLDSTASTLMMGPAFRAAKRFLEHYSNTHSEMHFCFLM